MPPEPRTRKNGQPQACEPCRKAKIRCDHASPKCSRCIMRRLECIYHPAPMTKPYDLSTANMYIQTPVPAQSVASGAPASPAVTPTDFQHIGLASPDGATRSSRETSTVGSFRASGSRDRATRTTIFQKEGALYETTRFSAVFSENRASFGPAIREVIEDNGQPTGTTENLNYHVGEDLEMTTPSRKALAINTLLNFPTARTCERLLKGLPFMFDVWISPYMIQQCMNQVWTEYSDCLGEGRSRESVLRMANDLIENGKQPLPTHSPNGEQDSDFTSWINWFGGPRLRWEMIGILFSWAGMAFKQMQDWDEVFYLPEQRGRSRQTAADKMRECSTACLQMCQDYSNINDIVVCLMKNSVKLQSIIVLDESDRLRIDFGTVISAFITDGLHRLPVTDKVTPLSQYRSCLSASMYYIDKTESLFNGRPPMLSGQYCHCPLPLDLCEEDVYNGNERLAAARARLDSNNWNTDNMIYTTTWLRALCFLSPIREGIVKLSLSVKQNFTKSQVEDLILQLDQIVNSYPPHIRYPSNPQWSQGPTSENGRSSNEMYIITRIQLDVLQCRFLLQRLLVSRGFCSGQELFDISHEMISIILSLWLNRDQLQNFCYAFDWIIVSYGIPSVGILCIELLRASNLAEPISTTTASYSINSGGGSNSSSTVVHPPTQLSRSDVIQTLTMFIAFLNWIRPTDNNAQLHSKFKRVIKRIIDTVLDPPRPNQQQQWRHAPQPQTTTTPDSSLQYPQLIEQRRAAVPETMGHPLDESGLALMLTDDLDWLNNVDWTEGHSW